MGTTRARWNLVTGHYKTVSFIIFTPSADQCIEVYLPYGLREQQ
jgi:hypothetical protein